MMRAPWSFAARWGRLGLQADKVGRRGLLTKAYAKGPSEVKISSFEFKLRI
jgi:hypothetical protein